MRADAAPMTVVGSISSHRQHDEHVSVRYAIAMVCIEELKQRRVRDCERKENKKDYGPIKNRARNESGQTSMS